MNASNNCFNCRLRVECIKLRVFVSNRTKLDWSEEEEKEHYRIGRTYNINSFVRHQRLSKDLADKIWLMQEAVRSLPPTLEAAAREIDDTPPPKDRPWATWSTPPIKGFDSSPYIDAEEDDDEDEDMMKGKL